MYDEFSDSLYKAIPGLDDMDVKFVDNILETFIEGALMEFEVDLDSGAVRGTGISGKTIEGIFIDGNASIPVIEPVYQKEPLPYLSDEIHEYKIFFDKAPLEMNRLTSIEDVSNFFENLEPNDPDLHKYKAKALNRDGKKIGKSLRAEMFIPS